MLRIISKFKKLAFCSVIGLIFFYANNEAYAIDCPFASVTQVGPVINTTTPTDDKVLVYLKNQNTTAVGTWPPNGVRGFYLDPSIENKGLATLLTAFTMDKMVYIRINSTDAAQFSLITVVNIR